MKTSEDLTISQLHHALQSGDLSATEIANATLDNIEKSDPTLNAFTHVTRDRMLSEAAKVDKLRASGGTLPPLAAVSYAVKNLLDVTGQVTLAGASLNSQNPVAQQDAWTVSRLASQGALLSGMTEMPKSASSSRIRSCSEATSWPWSTSILRLRNSSAACSRFSQ